MTRRFKREGKRYQLTFEDGDLDGFECIMRGISLEQFIDVTALETELQTPEGRTPENIEKQFSFIGSLLVSWNLDDEDGNPVPATYEGLRAQDFEFVMQVMKAYMNALAVVPKDSDSDSSAGGTSPERSLGLAGQSKSRAS